MEISPRFGFTAPSFHPLVSLSEQKVRMASNRKIRIFSPVGVGVHSNREMSVQIAKYGALETIILNLWWQERAIIARPLISFKGVQIYTLPLGEKLHFAFLLSERDGKIFYTSAIGTSRLKTAKTAWNEYRRRGSCSAAGLKLWAKGSDWLSNGTRYMLRNEVRTEEMKRISVLAYQELHKLSITTSQTGDGHYASYLD